MSMKEVVKTRLREMGEDSVERFEYPLVTLSLRIRSDLRWKLDVLRLALNYSSVNALLQDIVGQGAADAVDELREAEMRVNGNSADDLIEIGLANIREGRSTEGLLPDDVGRYAA